MSYFIVETRFAAYMLRNGYIMLWHTSIFFSALKHTQTHSASLYHFIHTCTWTGRDSRTFCLYPSEALSLSLTHSLSVSAFDHTNGIQNEKAQKNASTKPEKRWALAMAMPIVIREKNKIQIKQNRTKPRKTNIRTYEPSYKTKNTISKFCKKPSHVWMERRQTEK